MVADYYLVLTAKVPLCLAANGKTALRWYGGVGGRPGRVAPTVSLQVGVVVTRLKTLFISGCISVGAHHPKEQEDAETATYGSGTSSAVTDDRRAAVPLLLNLVLSVLALGLVKHLASKCLT